MKRRETRSVRGRDKCTALGFVRRKSPNGGNGPSDTGARRDVRVQFKTSRPVQRQRAVQCSGNARGAQTLCVPSPAAAGAAVDRGRRRRRRRVRRLTVTSTAAARFQGERMDGRLSVGPIPIRRVRISLFLSLFGRTGTVSSCTVFVFSVC